MPYVTYAVTNTNAKALLYDIQINNIKKNLRGGSAGPTPLFQVRRWADAGTYRLTRNTKFHFWMKRPKQTLPMLHVPHVCVVLLGTTKKKKKKGRFPPRGGQKEKKKKQKKKKKTELPAPGRPKGDDSKPRRSSGQVKYIKNVTYKENSGSRHLLYLPRRAANPPDDSLRGRVRGRKERVPPYQEQGHGIDLEPVRLTFFWVIPQRLNFICRRFGTLYVPSS